MSTYGTNIDAAFADLEAAASRVRRALASPIPNYQYVPSSDGTKAYLVQREWTCTCEGWKYRRTCRHLDEVIKR